MSKTTLDLELSDDSLRKLRALAMLSGRPIDDIKRQFSSYINKMLTEECAALLGLATVEAAKPYAQPQAVAKVAAQVAQVEAEEETSNYDMEDDVSGHGLSGDEDLGAKSLEEQVAEETGKSESKEDDDMLDIFNQAAAPVAGKDTDDYISAAMAAPPQDYAAVRSGPHGDERTRAATGTFEARRRQGAIARIQAFTGDEG